MNLLVNILSKSGLLKKDLDYNLLRASMVIIFLFFGYQKWWEYEAQILIPYISNGPLIWWMYPVFGIRGASWFLGVSEWLFGALLFWGFWNKKAGTFRRARFNRDVPDDRHHHSVHAERMGPGRRISRNGRQRSLPHEGRGSAGGLGLSAEGGRGQSVACRRAAKRSLSPRRA